MRFEEAREGSSAILDPNDATLPLPHLIGVLHFVYFRRGSSRLFRDPLARP